MIDLATERRRRRATQPEAEPVARPFDARLSAMIDAASVELESAADPATVRKWRRVAAALDQCIPPR